MNRACSTQCREVRTKFCERNLNRPLRSRRGVWEVNIKMGYEAVSWMRRCWLDSADSGCGQMASSCEHVNDNLGSVDAGNL
jgi:hypothetical protein